MNIESVFRQIPYFKNVKMDTILFESVYPVMFTCMNNEEVFLFLCCMAKGDGFKWIGTKTNYGVLVGLLENQITIRESFCTVTEEKVLISYDEKGVESNFVKCAEIPEYLLPTSGEYMDAEDGEYAEEISEFMKRDSFQVHTICERKFLLWSSVLLQSVVVLPDDNQSMGIPDACHITNIFQKQAFALV